MVGRPRNLLPESLASTSSSREYEQVSLTPRTPRSRAGFSAEQDEEGRFLGGHEEEEEEEEEEEDVNSAHPLLGSNRQRLFGKWSKSLGFHRLDSATVVDRLPVAAGCMVAGLFFFLSVLAYQSPGTLEFYIGVSSPVNSTIDTSLFISYANYSSFPLLPTQYVDECYKMHPGSFMKLATYWGEEGVHVMDVPHGNNQMGTCSSTITYMLDGRVGLGADLALMAQVAALARERNRTFLVDDTYWNRGKWTDHFQDVRLTQPGPEPGCLPPPPEELVACPRQARHWIINSHTAKFHLSHGFATQYEDAYSRNLNRLKPMFMHASVSLSETILPSEESARLIKEARKELKEVMKVDDSSSKPDSDSDSVSSNPGYIGVHIRHGDQRPKFTKGTEGGHIPLKDYVDAVERVRERGDSASASTMIYVASDDPVASDAFGDLLEGSTPRLRTHSLHKSANPSLRALVAPLRPGGYVQSDFNTLAAKNVVELKKLTLEKLPARDREERVEEKVSVVLTRGVVVDLALMSGMWIDAEDGDPEPKAEAVVCTIGSSLCLLSALPLSWSAAFGDMEPKGLGYPIIEKQRWVDVDEKGSVVPAWKGFWMF